MKKKENSRNEGMCIDKSRRHIHLYNEYNEDWKNNKNNSLKIQLKIAIIGIFMVSVFFCSACGKNNVPIDSQLFFDGIDDSGCHVVLRQKPQHIVSLNLSTDEILIELIDPERIAALSALADDDGLSSIKEKAMQIPVKIKNRNLETILAQQPDLVITTNGTAKELVQTLRDMAIPVFVSNNPTQFRELFLRIHSIGLITGSEMNAENLITELQKRLEIVEKRVQMIPLEKRRSIMAFSCSGVFGRSGGFFDDMCRHAGVINGAAVTGLTKDHPISKEQIIAFNPDMFLLPTWNSEGKNNDLYIDEIRNDPAYQKMKALQRGNLIFVSDRYRYSASQFAVNSVEVLAKAVYPEWF